MEYNQIKDTDLSISSITLGTWVFGGRFWGGADEKKCIEAVHCAIEHGINCIDTAPIYGDGVSEEVVGKAIEGKREKLIIATKCGLVSKGGKIVKNLRPESIEKEIEDSLRRLKTDYIDIYQCHWPDPETPVQKSLETLVNLKEAGKIRYIGLSNYTKDEFEEALQYGPIITSQNEYSLLKRDVEEDLLPFLREKEIGLLAYGSLAGGILTGKYKEPKHFKDDARNFFYKFYEGDAFKRTQQFLQELIDVGHPLNEIAINWVRAQEGVTTVLVGSRNKEQVDKNVKAFDWQLSEEQITDIENYLKDTIYA